MGDRPKKVGDGQKGHNHVGDGRAKNVGDGRATVKSGGWEIKHIKCEKGPK